jgi:2'-5' RNA ligase
MLEQTYALVVYLHGPLADLVNALRCELNRHHADKLAHISVLPPRPLAISEEAAVEEAQIRCDEWEPFQVEVSGVTTFLPVNGVVYLEAGAGAERMHVLHDSLNQGHLAGNEPYPFVPHITVAQEMNEEETLRVLDRVRQELQHYKGSRRFLVEKVTFVRLTPEGQWLDLADLQLGRAHVLIE